MLPASIENKIHNAMNKALKDAKWNFDISYRQTYQYTIYNPPETTKKRKVISIHGILIQVLRSIKRIN